MSEEIRIGVMMIEPDDFHAVKQTSVGIVVGEDGDKYAVVTMFVEGVDKIVMQVMGEDEFRDFAAQIQRLVKMAFVKPDRN